jgi:hypothetical protein
MAFIRCPLCEHVHDPVAEPFCPNCGRCPCCGSKPRTGEPVCGCGYPEHPAKVAQVERNFGIPPSLVGREKRRFAIRQRLASPRAWAFHIVFAVVPGIVLPLICGVRGLTCFAFFAVWFVCMFVYWSMEAIFWSIENRRLDQAPADEPPER